MTRTEYMACLRDLNQELADAQVAHDPDRVFGTAMAIEAFLEVVKVPPENDEDAKSTRDARDAKGDS